jgi:FHS family Na+ dependent glucose MFS transporter 1
VLQGFAIGQRGPAFLDLQIITQTDVEKASFFYTASSVGYLVGSLVAGVVYDKLNKSALLLLTVFGLGVSTVILPWCSLYGLMIAIHLICSIFGGGLDTS